MRRTVKILAVDDEEIILKSIKKALISDESFDYIITTSGTALESLKLIRSDTFDLVFMDIVLPGMNGLEVLRRIKNITPEVPVVVMSGFSAVRVNPGLKGDDTHKNEILKKAAAFLMKPFTTEEIKTLVTDLLR